MLLAIDTSAGTDVALVSYDGDIATEYREANPRHHAERIGVGIAQVLAEAGCTATDVRAVVAGMGPGPFTGLRVGVAAARTFAFARGVPLHPMCSHDAIAHEYRAAHGDGELLVTTDARRRELALSRYPASALTATQTRLVTSDAVLAGPRADAREVSAAHLALAWIAQHAAGLPERADSILYLRAPDAVPGAVPKRVTA